VVVDELERFAPKPIVAVDSNCASFLNEGAGLRYCPRRGQVLFETLT